MSRTSVSDAPFVLVASGASRASTGERNVSFRVDHRATGEETGGRQARAARFVLGIRLRVVADRPRELHRARPGRSRVASLQPSRARQRPRRAFVGTGAADDDISEVGATNLKRARATHVRACCAAGGLLEDQRAAREVDRAEVAPFHHNRHRTRRAPSPDRADLPRLFHTKHRGSRGTRCLDG